MGADERKVSETRDGWGEESGPEAPVGFAANREADQFSRKERGVGEDAQNVRKQQSESA